MSIQYIDGAMLRDMFLSGAALLEKNKTAIDALNVFPVPDGDTGTNMSMTMQGAVKELRTMPEGTPVETVMDAVSRGALRGARGNSGVILSQLYRGLAKTFRSQSRVTPKLFAEALLEGSTSAYKAVMRPKEGTILTVARLMGEEATKLAAKKMDVEAFLTAVIAEGERALAITPTLLPVLAEAGVVDSGGKGLMTIFYGFLSAVKGEEIDAFIPEEEAKPVQTEINIDSLTDDITFGYCTEFFIVHLNENFSEDNLELFREHLIRIGDSVVVASDADMVKVHVHSNAPGKILQLAMRFGELDKLKIENMREQNRQLIEQRRQSEKEYALIAVSTGDGIDAIFADLSVNHIISGGQTMNPSIDTIVNAIKKVNARNVFVLPNNGNIILAAQQARDLCDCNVIVLPTKTIPQGISAAMAFNPDDTVTANEENMRHAFTEVVSGSVTYAVRDTQFHGKQIAHGDIIGMLESDLTVVSTSVDDASEQLLHLMVEKKGSDDPVITIYYGDDMDEEHANALAQMMQDELPDADVMVQNGGQPLYYYYFSVE